MTAGESHDGLAQPTAAGFAPIAHPQDTQAQRNYLQTYTYDPVGNILRMKHVSGGATVWHRGYDYAQDGNRLLKTSLPGDDPDDPQTYSAAYAHDVHGSMTAMPSIPGGLSWDPHDRLQSTDHQGGGVTYYVYDSAGLKLVQTSNIAAKSTHDAAIVIWDPMPSHNVNFPDAGISYTYNAKREPISFDAPTMLFHELFHSGEIMTGHAGMKDRELRAIKDENTFRDQYHKAQVQRGIPYKSSVRATHEGEHYDEFEKRRP